MRVDDAACRATGLVTPSFVNVRTGEREPFRLRHNTLSYMSAEAMAAAFGGDPSYIPSRIGFIYGDNDTLPFSGTTVSSRYQDWNSLESELSGASGTVDVQVVGFSYSPTLGPGAGGGSSSGDEGDYGHILPGGANAVTFHAVSNSQDNGELDYDTFKVGSYIYQCLLLSQHEGKYYIIARASLERADVESSGSSSGAYLQKPDGFEVALDWTVTFL